MLYYQLLRLLFLILILSSSARGLPSSKGLESQAESEDSQHNNVPTASTDTAPTASTNTVPTASTNTVPTASTNTVPTASSTDGTHTTSTSRYGSSSVQVNNGINWATSSVSSYSSEQGISRVTSSSLVSTYASQLSVQNSSPGNQKSSRTVSTSLQTLNSYEYSSTSVSFALASEKTTGQYSKSATPTQTNIGTPLSSERSSQTSSISIAPLSSASTTNPQASTSSAIARAGNFIQSGSPLSSSESIESSTSKFGQDESTFTSPSEVRSSRSGSTVSLSHVVTSLSNKVSSIDYRTAYQTSPTGLSREVSSSVITGPQSPSSEESGIASSQSKSVVMENSEASSSGFKSSPPTTEQATYSDPNRGQISTQSQETLSISITTSLTDSQSSSLKARASGSIHSSSSNTLSETISTLTSQRPPEAVSSSFFESESTSGESSLYSGMKGSDMSFTETSDDLTTVDTLAPDDDWQTSSPTPTFTTSSDSTSSWVPRGRPGFIVITTHPSSKDSDTMGPTDAYSDENKSNIASVPSGDWQTSSPTPTFTVSSDSTATSDPDTSYPVFTWVPPLSSSEDFDTTDTTDPTDTYSDEDTSYPVFTWVPPLSSTEDFDTTDPTDTYSDEDTSYTGSTGVISVSTSVPSGDWQTSSPIPTFTASSDSTGFSVPHSRPGFIVDPTHPSSEDSDTTVPTDSYSDGDTSYTGSTGVISISTSIPSGDWQTSSPTPTFTVSSDSTATSDSDTSYPVFTWVPPLSSSEDFDTTDPTDPTDTYSDGDTSYTGSAGVISVSTSVPSGDWQTSSPTPTFTASSDSTSSWVPHSRPGFIVNPTHPSSEDSDTMGPTDAYSDESTSYTGSTGVISVSTSVPSGDWQTSLPTPTFTVSSDSSTSSTSDAPYPLFTSSSFREPDSTFQNGHSTDDLPKTYTTSQASKLETSSPLSNVISSSRTTAEGTNQPSAYLESSGRIITTPIQTTDRTYSITTAMDSTGLKSSSSLIDVPSGASSAIDAEHNTSPDTSKTYDSTGPSSYILISISAESYKSNAGSASESHTIPLFDGVSSSVTDDRTSTESLAYYSSSYESFTRSDLSEAPQSTVINEGPSQSFRSSGSAASSLWSEFDVSESGATEVSESGQEGLSEQTGSPLSTITQTTSFILTASLTSYYSSEPDLSEHTRISRSDGRTEDIYLSVTTPQDSYAFSSGRLTSTIHTLSPTPSLGTGYTATPAPYIGMSSTRTGTTWWLPNSIQIQSRPPNSKSSSFDSSATATLPQVIAPPTPVASPVGSRKVTVGFKADLNYEFVTTNPLSSAQIFHFLPSVLSYPFEEYTAEDLTNLEKRVSFLVSSLQSDGTTTISPNFKSLSGRAHIEDSQSLFFNSSDVKMIQIMPLVVDGRNYLVSVAVLYFPSDFVSKLQEQIVDLSSKLYKNTDPSLAALAALIDSSIPLTGLINDPDSAPSSINGGYPIQSQVLPDSHKLKDNNADSGSLESAADTHITFVITKRLLIFLTCFASGTILWIVLFLLLYKMLFGNNEADHIRSDLWPEYLEKQEFPTADIVSSHSANSTGVANGGDDTPTNSGDKIESKLRFSFPQDFIVTGDNTVYSTVHGLEYFVAEDGSFYYAGAIQSTSEENETTKEGSGGDTEDINEYLYSADHERSIVAIDEEFYDIGSLEVDEDGNYVVSDPSQDEGPISNNSETVESYNNNNLYKMTITTNSDESGDVESTTFDSFGNITNRRSSEAVGQDEVRFIEQNAKPLTSTKLEICSNQSAFPLYPSSDSSNLIQIQDDGSIDQFMYQENNSIDSALGVQIDDIDDDIDDVHVDDLDELDEEMYVRISRIMSQRGAITPSHL